MIADNHTNRVYFSSLLPEEFPVLWGAMLLF